MHKQTTFFNAHFNNDTSQKRKIFKLLILESTGLGIRIDFLSVPFQQKRPVYPDIFGGNEKTL